MEAELGLDGKDEVGHVVRCTPTLRNVKESNAKSKAQLIVLQNGVSQLVITFRTSKAEYSDDKIRAAKIRFMLIFLPHLKGSTIEDFCSYYLEYLDYSKRGQTRGIDVLVAKQHAKLNTRQEKNPGLFRTPAGVHKFKNLVQAELMRQGHVPDWSDIDPPPMTDDSAVGAGAGGSAAAADGDDMSWIDDDDVAMQVTRGASTVSDWGLASSSRSLEGLINHAIGAQASVSAGAGRGSGAGAMSGAGGGTSSVGAPSARSPSHGGIPVSAPMGAGGGSVGRRSHHSRGDASSAASVASSSSGVHVSELGRVKAAISAAKARTDEAAALVEDLERKLSLGNESEFPDVGGPSAATSTAAAPAQAATRVNSMAPTVGRNTYAEQALAQAQASRIRSDLGYQMAPPQPLSPTVAPTGRGDPLMNPVRRSDYMRDCLDAIDMVAQQGDMLAEMEDPMYSYFNLQAGGPVMQQLGSAGGAPSARIGDGATGAPSHRSRPV